MLDVHHIPARFHVGYCLLGRAMRRRMDDPRRAESLFIAVLILLATGLILIYFLLTAAVGSAVAASLWVWGGELLLVLLFAGTCVVGVQPRITITVADDRLDIRRGSRGYVLPFDEVDDAERISDQIFHRHYRRYRNTRSFVNRVPATVLVLRTGDGPVVLGLPEPAQEELVDAISSSRLVPPPPLSVTS